MTAGYVSRTPCGRFEPLGLKKLTGPATGPHDVQAYCKACHGKLFGTKGYGAGAPPATAAQTQANLD